MSRSRVQRLHSWTARIWESAQVELHGQYTIDHLQDFAAYHANTSWPRALLVCLLTPLPGIALVLLVDLIPLEPIDRGTRGSPHVWLRQWLSIMTISLCTMEQFRHHLPQLHLGHWGILFVSLCASSSAVIPSYALSSVVGYPLPFTIVVGTGPWFLTTSLLIYILKRHRLNDEPGLSATVRRYLLVLLCQVALTIIYPLYNFIYKSLTSWQQTASIFLLPIIKMITKNWISFTLPDSDDAKPEAVVFNVEIFHSLFVALCMGNTTSTRTVVLLMLVDFVQAWISFQDIYVILRALRPLAVKLNIDRRRRTSPALPLPRRGIQQLLELAMCVISTEPQRTDRCPHAVITPRRRDNRSVVFASARAMARITFLKLSDRFSRRHRRAVGSPTVAHLLPIDGPNARPPPHSSRAAVAPLSDPPLKSTSSTVLDLQLATPQPQNAFSSDLACLTVVERGVLVHQTQKLLFVTEFVVLIEYTEVIMPLMYCVYVVVLFHFPNREYYSFLEGLSTSSELTPAIANVLLYASLEFVSLVLMSAILWWKLRMSLVHQLAFVLERHCLNIQAKLVMWVVDIIQTSVLQLGPDYSFKFAWLSSS